MEILDARGLSCPEPVIMLSKAMMSKENKYQMIVDSPTAKENVSNYGKKQGYNVNITEQNGEYTLTFTKCERKAPKFIYGDISSLKNNDSISLFFIVLYF
ncbi:sulfurtransferase TusA family protein [Megamonas funiformis]